MPTKTLLEVRLTLWEMSNSSDRNTMAIPNYSRCSLWVVFGWWSRLNADHFHSNRSCESPKRCFLSISTLKDISKYEERAMVIEATTSPRHSFWHRCIPQPACFPFSAPPFTQTYLQVLRLSWKVDTWNWKCSYCNMGTCRNVLRNLTRGCRVWLFESYQVLSCTRCVCQSGMKALLAASSAAIVYWQSSREQAPYLTIIRFSHLLLSLVQQSSELF